MAIDFSSVGPTCQKIEDLIEYARPILNRWPPFYRYTIGEQIYLELISTQACYKSAAQIL